MAATIRIPAPQAQAAVNLLGVISLIGVCVAVGGLAGWWWALLLAGTVGTALAVIATTHVQAEAADAAADEPVVEPVVLAEAPRAA